MTSTLRAVRRIAWGLWTLRFLALTAAALMLGCSTTIVPPRSPLDPVPVFLLDHGGTTSLVLPATDNRMVRYAYGDWNWYALANTQLSDGLRALFWSGRATLGRQELQGAPQADTVRGQFPAAYIENLHTLTAGRADVDRLRARLDAEHAVGRRITIVETPDFIFVPHPRHYSYFHNSNHAVAEWLRELDCEIDGLAFRSRWRIERP